MIFCILVILTLTLLFLLSAGTRLPRGCAPAPWQTVFYKAAYYLLRHAKRRNRRAAAGAFETERLAAALMVLFAGAGLSLLLQAAAAGRTILGDGYELNRPSKGQGSYVQELNVQFEDSTETEQMEITVAERRYSEEEQEAFLEQALQELEGEVLGENTSPDEVRGSVSLPAKLADGAVSVQWVQDPAGLLDEEGNISKDVPEEGALLQLTATLLCGSRQRMYECALRLFPPIYSEEEKLHMALESEVTRADEESAQNEKLTLPREVQGRRIIWQEPASRAAGVCLAVTLLVCAGVWISKGDNRRKQEEKRRRQMILDYPDLLFKLSMLLNAGLTMQAAFFRAAAAYDRRRTKEIHYAYEEMLTACREMKSGVPEARAYENFGRRCGVNSYNKLGMMLSSNLQKGSEGLADALQDLASSAMEERSQMAKKLGEEAGTKLLLPMMLMLLVVLAILMAPAILAF